MDEVAVLNLLLDDHRRCTYETSTLGLADTRGRSLNTFELVREETHSFQVVQEERSLRR